MVLQCAACTEVESKSCCFANADGCRRDPVDVKHVQAIIDCVFELKSS